MTQELPVLSILAWYIENILHNTWTMAKIGWYDQKCNQVLEEKHFSVLW